MMLPALRLVSYSEVAVFTQRPGCKLRYRVLSPRRVATIHRAVMARRLGLLGAVRAALSVSAGVL